MTLREILESLVCAVRNGMPVCYTALVETRGSTPQKPGAAMLVFPDGEQCGTLGGGCVEAEVKNRALTAMQQRSGPQLASFQLDHDYGWDDGLICGGRMTMLIWPAVPDDAAALRWFKRWQDLLQAGAGATQAVFLDDNEAASQVLFTDDGTVAERFPPDMPEEAVQTAAASLCDLAERPRPYVQDRISYLPFLPRCRLVIVGAGHVGQQVAELAAAVEFDVWVIDDRQEYCSEERFPHAMRRITGDLEHVLPSLESDANSFGIIVTRGHKHDQEALFHLIGKPWRYLGLIGSRRKIRMIFENLSRDGVSGERLERVHAPLGLDIGSQTVPEIAVSIVAELIAVRNLRRQERILSAERTA